MSAPGIATTSMQYPSGNEWISPLEMTNFGCAFGSGNSTTVDGGNILFGASKLLQQFCKIRAKLLNTRPTKPKNVLS